MAAGVQVHARCSPVISADMRNKKKKKKTRRHLSPFFVTRLRGTHESFLLLSSRTGRRFSKVSQEPQTARWRSPASRRSPVVRKPRMRGVVLKSTCRAARRTGGNHFRIEGSLDPKRVRPARKPLRVSSARSASFAARFGRL